MVGPGAILVVLALLVLAAEAQAYVPGQLIWAKRIGTSAGEAAAWAVAAGPNGVTAIAGWTSPAPTGRVPMVARFTAGGAKWVRTYADAGNGRADAVAIDKAGNVYVAATVDQRGGDIVVLKYDKAGVFQWATEPYDGTGGGSQDEARELAVDGSGNVVVAGESYASSPGKRGVVVLKYDWDGRPTWAEPGGFYPQGSDPDAGDLTLHDLALGPTGDVYVAGSLARRVDGVWQEYALLVRFAAGDGRWASGWHGPGRALPGACFESLAVRGYRVVAVGYTVDPANDSVGDALLRTFDLHLAPVKQREWGVGNGTFEWLGDVVLDGKGSVYVTGEQELDRPDGWSKAVTMKLSPTLARIVWKATYLPRSRDAECWYIARDALGNLYVAGVKETGDTLDFLTIKYGPTGARKWLRTWSGGGPGDDEPSGLVLGTKGGVYVGGEATGKGDVLQAVLLKYQK